MADKFVNVLVFCFILSVSLSFTVIIGLHNYGDSPSYRLMIDSFLHDKDFILDGRDIQRWDEKGYHPWGAYVMIDREGMVRYGKPLLYPLVAAPFVFLFGDRGIILLNSLFLAGSIICVFLWFRRGFNIIYSLLLSFLFFFCSYIPLYTGWIHQEEMIFFACALSMYLCLVSKKPVLAASIIGFVSTSRVVFSLLLIPVVVYLVRDKEYRKVWKVMVSYVVSAFFVYILTLLFLKGNLPYSGEAGYGYIPARYGRYLTVDDIKQHLVFASSQFIGFRFNSIPLFFRNILSFVFGRFSGIFWYAFPAIVCLAIYLFYRRRTGKREKTVGDSVIVVFSLLMVILIIARPLNYFGGMDFICNRYFFILPALAFLPGIKKINPLILVFAFLPGLVVVSQIVKNEVLGANDTFFLNRERHILKHSAHTCGWPLKWTPLEIPQIEAMMVYSVRVRPHTRMYFPCGVKDKIKDRFLLDERQELIVVQDINSREFELMTGSSGIVALHPRFVLRSLDGAGYKTFYHFKPGKAVWINGSF